MDFVSCIPLESATKPKSQEKNWIFTAFGILKNEIS